MIDDWGTLPTIFVLNFFTFLEFSKNRLAALMARQATHACRTYFLGFSMNHLVAKSYPSGEACGLSNFSPISYVSMILKCLH